MNFLTRFSENNVVNATEYGKPVNPTSPGVAVSAHMIYLQIYRRRLENLLFQQVAPKDLVPNVGTLSN